MTIFWFSRTLRLLSWPATSAMPSMDDHFGLRSPTTLIAVYALVQEENAAVGGLDLDALFVVQVFNVQVDAPLFQPHGQVGLAQLGDLVQHDERVGVQAQVVQPAQVDGQAAVGGAHRVFFEQGQVGGGFLVAFVVGALDESLALDVLMRTTLALS